MNVVELRRYAMRPGRRDDLIDLFEREFIETQEACGMTPVGHYRDLNDARSFVWFRGFENMEMRPGALEKFYLQSETWRRHRDAANDTLADSDNVLLLRPARGGSGFDLRGLSRAASASASNRLVAAAITMLDGPADEAHIAEFERKVLPQARALAQRVAYFVTEEQPNNFVRLPVREGEFAFVVTGICEDAGALEAWQKLFPQGETLRLQPAARALYR